MTVEELLEKYAQGVTDFSNIDLSEANLSGAKLVGANFTGANLSVINLSGANLSGANLTDAKLNVARLSGAHLTQAILNNASFNVANLIRSDLSRAQIRGASLIRAELIRADLSGADLLEANLSSADLREATLRHATLRRANLSEATLRGASLTGANLEQANLSSTDLGRCDLSGANFREAELRQANLSRANLSGANLSGANLRWTDLSGAKLSGANLVGADLSNANLTSASLVHANLTQAKLIKAEWIGADLTGATLTGAKLYATSRFGLKTESITCEWVDLSPAGDRSIIQYFNTEDSRDFFNETPPTIRIVIDAALEQEASFALAGAYYQISQQYRELKQPPSTEVGRRRTVLTFRVDSDEALLTTAYMAILPFKDTAITHRNISMALEMMNREDIAHLGFKSPHLLNKLSTLLEEAKINAIAIQENKKILEIAAKINFFRAPTQTILTNSSSQNLILHDHPNFGKRLINRADMNTPAYDDRYDAAKSVLPSLSMVVDFVKGFHYIA
jgi:uncharacterized protein YjbI with pentapeptide repeats